MMMNSKLNFLKLLELLLWLAAGLYLVSLLLPVYERYLIYYNAEPKVVTARGSLADRERSTINIFNYVSPSVVFISKDKIVNDLQINDVRNVPKETGSGFIWDEFGHIVTNYHIVSGASEVNIQLNDGNSYEASVVGISPNHDLAVLKIDVPFKFHLPLTVAIGTSDDLQVGQSVFAIGNLLGTNHTLTSGVVSALNRSLSSDLDDSDVVINHLIQTDSATPHGNSGGPLLDSSGRLIGIITAIYSHSGAYGNVSFAVPIDTVNKVIPQLIAHGRYTDPSLEAFKDDAS
jgi:S1-C subfamily serine protease